MHTQVLERPDLSATDLRKTPDRLTKAILRAIAASRHPTIGDIHKLVSVQIDVSEDQVRRIVGNLRELGLAQVRHTEVGQRFQLGAMPTPVLVCIECGKMEDLDIDDRMGPMYLPAGDGRVPVSIQMIDQGFQAVSFRFDIYGFCASHHYDRYSTEHERTNRSARFDVMDLWVERYDDVRFDHRFIQVDPVKVERRERLVEKALDEGWLSGFEHRPFFEDLEAIHKASIAHVGEGRQFRPPPTGYQAAERWARLDEDKPLPVHWRARASGGGTEERG